MTPIFLWRMALFWTQNNTLNNRQRSKTKGENEQRWQRWKVMSVHCWRVMSFYCCATLHEITTYAFSHKGCGRLMTRLRWENLDVDKLLSTTLWFIPSFLPLCSVFWLFTEHFCQEPRAATLASPQSTRQQVERRTHSAFQHTAANGCFQLVVWMCVCACVRPGFTYMAIFGAPCVVLITSGCKTVTQQVCVCCRKCSYNKITSS